jgi:hypothetical protein
MILIDGCNKNHSNSRPVLARKPTSSAGRCYPSQAGLHPPGLLGDGVFGQVGQRPLQMRPDRLDRVELVGVGRQPEPRQPRPGQAVGAGPVMVIP